MSNIISISGIIGLDVTANDIRDELKKADGQPVEAEIGSPGGLIVEGIEIYNLFRLYKGHKTARIMGLAGSMSAIIPLAFDKIEAFSNSVYFLHQAITTVFGANKDDLQYQIGVLTGFDNILISALESRSGRKREDIESMMKAETFIFGKSIKENGFADIILDSDINPNEDLAVTNAMSEFYACQEKIKSKDQKIDKIAAYLNKVFIPPPERPAISKIQNEVKRMDINQIKAEYPDVYQAIVKTAGDERETEIKQTYVDQGKALGQIEERKRISDIKALALPGQDDLTNKMINEGVSVNEAAVKFLAAQKETLNQIGTGIENDLQAAVLTDVPNIPKDPDKKEEKIVDGKSTDEEMKAAFEKSADLQAEFGGDLGRYTAYLKAEAQGRAKILNKGGK